MSKLSKQKEILSNVRKEKEKWFKKHEDLNNAGEEIYNKKVYPWLYQEIIEKNNLALIKIKEYPEEYLKSEKMRLEKEIRETEEDLKKL